MPLKCAAKLLAGRAAFSTGSACCDQEPDTSCARHLQAHQPCSRPDLGVDIYWLPFFLSPLRLSACWQQIRHFRFTQLVKQLAGAIRAKCLACIICISGKLASLVFLAVPSLSVSLILVTDNASTPCMYYLDRLSVPTKYTRKRSGRSAIHASIKPAGQLHMIAEFNHRRLRWQHKLCA